MLLCALMLGTSALLQAQAVPASDTALIRQARKAQNRFIAAGQIDSAATFWVRDVIVVAGLGAVVRGRDSLAAAFAGDQGMIYQRNPTHIQVSLNWPIAWEEGSWAGRRTGDSGPALLSGRYSAQWVKLDGHWRIRAEQFVTLSCRDNPCRWHYATLRP